MSSFSQTLKGHSSYLALHFCFLGESEQTDFLTVKTAAPPVGHLGNDITTPVYVYR